MELKNCVKKLNIELRPELAEEWDNVGLLVGDLDSTVKKIVVSLDANEDTIRKAIKNEADLLITHHPLFFRPLKQLVTDNNISRDISLLIKNNIALYVAHTNLDVLDWGTGLALCNSLGLIYERPFINSKKSGDNELGFGAIASVDKKILASGLKERIEKGLGSGGVKIYNWNPKKKINKIALLPGSGSSFIKMLSHDVDVYISSDLKYHDIEDCPSNVMLIDVGHDISELPVVPELKNRISKLLGIKTEIVSKRKRKIIVFKSKNGVTV